jgi:bacteriocin-like protein
MDKKNNKRNKKGLKTRAVPVPPAVTELNEEDLKKVTGGSFQWGVGAGTQSLSSGGDSPSES